MPVNLIQYRGEIGIFHGKCYCPFRNSKFSLLSSVFNICFSTFFICLKLCVVVIKSLFFTFLMTACKTNRFSKLKCFCLYLTISISYVTELWFFVNSILLSGDVELHPGPDTSSSQTLSIYHWNLNSLSVRNFEKVNLLSAFNTLHNFDILCLSETYLNSGILSDDVNLEIQGYTLVRCDHPSDTHRGGVCIYFKSCLPIKVSNVTLLNESLLFELKIGNKLCSFLTLYRSPSQSNEQFNEFLENFELSLDNMATNNPFLMTVIGDFNAKSKNWCSTDNASTEGTEIEILTSHYGLSQLIKEPTFIINNSKSCIDLIFTSQPNLVTESGILSSLHPNCHHQIVFSKFNLQIYYPPPFEREVWHYQYADIDHINQAISDFNWERAFAEKDVNHQVLIFNNVVLNIMRNYIPNETLTFDDRDPPWINNKIKKMVKDNDCILNKLMKSNNCLIIQRKLIESQEKLRLAMEKSKQNYFEKMSKKLNDNHSRPKSYWSLLKIFLIGKKIPCIPPLFHCNKYITDFKEKCELFNSFFATQCSVIDTNSTIPTNIVSLTDNSLNDIIIESSDILKVLMNLDPNKSHGPDMISIRMLKLCHISICKPLIIIFKNCMNHGKFPSEWKKANVVPIHKKGDKQLLKNYRPISLLPICGKMFERILYNKLYPFLEQNNLISQNQSGFRSGDSCINQLLSITHEIFESIDQGFEVRGVFLDISKAFDRVWHEGLIFKLKQNGIGGSFLKVLTDFLTLRKQRVVLNGQVSTWKNIDAGVPQGSILGPLLFLVYINDLPDGLISNTKMFADDTSLFVKVLDMQNSARTLNDDLNMISLWANQWKMSFNPDPSKQANEVIFSHKVKKPLHPSLFFNNSHINETTNQKHLGTTVYLLKIFYKQSILKLINLLLYFESSRIHFHVSHY